MQGINIQEGFDWQSLQPYLCYVPGDLQEDLFYLKAKVFPQLDALCQTRGTCFRPVDLQQNKDVSKNHLFDQQLKIRLDLIDRSSFFICLLGQTYGQCLSDLGPYSLSEFTKNLNVAANSGYPWVVKDEYRNCSLTELEITKAAFIDKHRSCFFYFKDCTPQESDDHGSEEMCIFLDMLSRQSQSERQRMRELKGRIINNCLPVRFFRNQCELGEMIGVDWEKVISKIAEEPKRIVAGWQASTEHHYHKSYSRTLCNWFVPSVSTTEMLNAFNEFLHPITKNAKSERHSRTPGAHFTSDLDLNELGKSILLVSGERGCGKSTLAAWCLEAFYKQNPALPVIYHFCRTNTDIRSLLRFCSSQLRRAHYGDPADWDESLEDTSEYLHRAVQTFSAAVNLGPCILLIDGIDLLTETLGLSKQEVKALQWLPAPLPPYCKMIITTTFTDLTYKSLTSRTDVQILKCPNFSDPCVQCSILQKHLSLPYKGPPNSVLQRMVRGCRSPAVLALIGTELRTCGVLREKEEEMELLKEYVDADSVPELWVKVIHRWVKDYSRSPPSKDVMPCREGWVWDILCLIHVSRAGLAESQVLVLLEDLGYCGPLRVQVLEWARLRSAIWPWIREKANGLLIIMHQALSQAMNLLLDGTESQNSYHQILATFFQKSSFEICNWAQKMEEIPWHLMQTGSFKELHEFLIDPATLEFLSSRLKHYPQLTVNVLHYWTLLRKKGFDPMTSFQTLKSFEHLTDAHTSDHSLSLFCSKVLLYLGEMRKAEELLLQADQILQKAVELDNDSMRLLLDVQHMLVELYVQMHLPKDTEIYCHKGFETAQSCLDSAEVKLIVGQLLCRLCLTMLEEGRLFEVPGLLKKIRSASYISTHPCAEGTVMLLKAIHKLSLGALKTAERLLQSALVSRRRWFGHDHLLVAELEELLADLWANSQTNTEWTQRQMVELYRHVISTKETEAQASQLPSVQHGLAIVLRKLGEVLLRSCSKLERREGLDLLQRSADIHIQLLGSEHPKTQTIDHVLNHIDVGQSKHVLGLMKSCTNNEPLLGKKSQSELLQPLTKSCITTKLNRSYSTASSHNQDETLKRPWMVFQVSVFGPQSDINSLLQTQNSGLFDRCPARTKWVSKADVLYKRKL